MRRERSNRCVANRGDPPTQSVVLSSAVLFQFAPNSCARDRALFALFEVFLISGWLCPANPEARSYSVALPFRSELFASDAATSPLPPDSLSFVAELHRCLFQ